jgi:N-acetylated-alpha-linked acidic dipeptidase
MRHAHELRQPGLPVGDGLFGGDDDARDGRRGDGVGRARHGSDAKAQTPEPFERLRVLQYWHLRRLHGLLDDAAEVERRGWHRVGGCGGNIAWHTEDDTLKIADKGVLAKDIALYLEAVVTFANAEVLPFDFRATLEELSAVVEGYAEAAAGRLDLAPESSCLGELAGKIAAFHADVASGKIAPAIANEAMRALSRALVPLNYARGGPFVQDPAVSLPPVPLLSIAADLDHYDKDTIGFALATLLRGRNAALDAIDRAELAVARALVR